MLHRIREMLMTPRLDWLQVEISSRCNAACSYCPHTIFADRWQSRLMDPVIFERLSPVLQKTGLVFLQGWGEPFLHPEFFRFVDLAKSHRCRVGTTSNGTLLDEQRCQLLVQKQVDIVGFSLAGTDTGNDRIRLGTSLAQVLERIDCLRRLKQQENSALPAIHIAYLLLRSQLAKVHHLPDLLKNRGIEQVVISTLDFLGNASVAGEAVPLSSGEHEEVRQILVEVEKQGRKAGLAIHFRLPLPAPASCPQTAATRPDSTCSENIQHAAVVAADGGVFPCVFTNLPIPPGTPLFPGGTNYPFQPLSFGNLRDRTFVGIWRSAAYSNFRRAHTVGDTPPPCRGCAKIRLSSAP